MNLIAPPLVLFEYSLNALWSRKMKLSAAEHFVLDRHTDRHCDTLSFCQSQKAFKLIT